MYLYMYVIIVLCNMPATDMAKKFDLPKRREKSVQSVAGVVVKHFLSKPLQRFYMFF